MQIGKAIFNYDEKGKQLSAYFMSTMPIDVNDNLLQDISTGQDSEIIRKNAEIVLASWFAKINNIELEDREDVKIESRIDTCTKYPNGIVRMCIVEFNLLKISELKK